ncbi:MAG: preprotein translocase subunit YajC [Ruminococcus sp.]|nr:preprotein translocase subunit YajC [Ruminococcus sp.]
MSNITLLTASTAQGQVSPWSSIILMGVLLVLFYFVIIRPQKKQEKKEKAMRDSLEVGDEVITNGGIVGIVFSIKDDTLVIETGSDRSKIRVMKWAIAKVNTVHEDD